MTNDKLNKSVELMPGAYVSPYAILEENITVGPNAVILANDSAGKTVIRSGVEIGANSTILPNILIGFNARVLPGSVVTRSVPPMAIVEGNPARIIGYTNITKADIRCNSQTETQNQNIQHSGVKDVTFHTLPMIPDLRGNLSVGEFGFDIPFTPKRYFMIYDVPDIDSRGEHAHFKCKQFLVAAKGTVKVIVDDGHLREEFHLNKPNFGIYLPPMVWATQYQYSKDSVLLVFASEHYDNDDYIRNYDEFLTLTSKK